MLELEQDNAEEHMSQNISAQELPELGNVIDTFLQRLSENKEKEEPVENQAQKHRFSLPSY